MITTRIVSPLWTEISRKFKLECPWHGHFTSFKLYSIQRLRYRSDLAAFFLGNADGRTQIR